METEEPPEKSTQNEIETQQSANTTTEGKRAILNATNTEYLHLLQLIGTETITGASETVSGSTSNANVATYENGKISAHSVGIATSTVPMENGDTNYYYVSVYWPYPQPKTARITGTGPVQLVKWGKYGTTEVTGTFIYPGDIVSVLYRTDDQTSGGELMQYVRTSSGQTGWMSNDSNAGRAMPNYYRQEVAVGEQKWLNTSYNGVDYTDYDFKLVSGSPAFVSITKATNSGVPNQHRIKGLETGVAYLTSSFDSSGITLRNTAKVTVYQSVLPTNGTLNKDCAAFFGADDSYPVELRNKEESVTISGWCDDYWRIGEQRFVHKSDVILDPLKLTCPLKTNTKIRLSWNGMSGYNGYEVYQEQAGSYQLINTITEGKTTTCDVTGLKTKNTYSFKVRPFIIINGETVYFEDSNICKVTTRNKTDGYFYNKALWTKEWPGIKITKGKVL